MKCNSSHTAYSPTRIAKDFQKLLSFVGEDKKLSWCQELAARALGCDDWYGLAHTADRSSVGKDGDWTETSPAALEKFGIPAHVARYLASPYSKVASTDQVSLTSTLDAISGGVGRDHFQISLNPQSPNCGKIAFQFPGEDECRWEPIRRPALLACLKELWEIAPGKMRGDTPHHQYYVGGANRWKLDAFAGVLVVVGQTGRQ